MINFLFHGSLNHNRSVLIIYLIPGSDLFSAHRTDFAVELDLAVLDQILCSAAGVAQPRKFHQIIQSDKLFADRDNFHFFFTVGSDSQNLSLSAVYSAAKRIGTTKNVKLCPSTGLMIIGCKLPLSITLTSSVSAFFSASSR